VFFLVEQEVSRDNPSRNSNKAARVYFFVDIKLTNSLIQYKLRFYKIILIF